ncbi:FAD-binding protein [Desulfitobacterium chlororespirans]|uniref:Tat (Twin-arginine translocation) pathway signal sequence n=1 Tax=Desulfitobacterium chlororespirans DSM 11544 TaxID=1121395 RepID=A0A1M7UXP4_9FIRM|nr:FAD-binding protein [Desulfitobacterium chlororespirans]SHN87739.1 Tat (twin-arginine translocation) pathway signal sequence [Desulfitobacterium chlororespirans DSM 11544]
MENMNRRNFLKKATVGAAALAGASMLTACGTPETVKPNSDTSPAGRSWDYEVDAVVVGGGHGGLCAAATALERGKKVLLVEISGIVGGGSAWSGGILHTFGTQTYEEYLEYSEGLHDPVLGKLFFETFKGEFMPWVQNTVGAPVYIMGPQAGPNGRPQDKVPNSIGDKEWKMGSKEDKGYAGLRKYFKAIEDYVKAKGGTVLLKTRGLNLITDGEKVVGLKIVTKGEEPKYVKAGAVVLATGNFFANKGLLTQFVGPYAYRAKVMGVPYATGDGMRMGLGVGAMLSEGLSTWSGTLVCVTHGKAVTDDPEAYEKVIETDPDNMPGINKGRPNPPWFGTGTVLPELVPAIVVNLNGKRFKDEAHPIDSKYPRLTDAVLVQPEGMAFVIGDQAMSDAGAAAMMKIIKDEGVKVVEGATLEEFAANMEKAGVYKANLLKTIREYNEAIDKGTTMELEVPREYNLNKISTPPFYGVPVTGQVYCNFGGLAINEKVQVLDHQKQPIPGLYAVPPAAGGVMRSIYTGSIALAGTFGWLAGKQV